MPPADRLDEPATITLDEDGWMDVGDDERFGVRVAMNLLRNVDLLI
jgi:hypothetical protein